MDEPELDAVLGKLTVREVPVSKFGPATKLGDTIRMTREIDERHPAGTTGTVVHIDEGDMITIELDTGDRAIVVPHIDKWEMSS